MADYPNAPYRQKLDNMSGQSTGYIRVDIADRPEFWYACTKTPSGYSCDLHGPVGIDTPAEIVLVPYQAWRQFKKTGLVS